MGDLIEKTNRVMTNYAVTRRQKREIAKINMKKAGKKQICKHYDKETNQLLPSYFAMHWKEYVEVE